MRRAAIRFRRLMALGGTAVLCVALTGNAPATADSQTFSGSGGLGFTVDGGPVALIGDDGVNCAVPENERAEAHLSGPLTLTLTSLPSGTSFEFITFGHRGGYYELSGAQRPLETVFTIPVDGGGVYGVGFTCNDAILPTTFPVDVDAYDSDGNILDLVQTELTLSAVD
jgi:hypothetical protein